MLAQILDGVHHAATAGIGGARPAGVGISVHVTHVAVDNDPGYRRLHVLKQVLEGKSILCRIKMFRFGPVVVRWIIDTGHQAKPMDGLLGGAANRGRIIRGERLKQKNGEGREKEEQPNHDDRVRRQRFEHVSTLSLSIKIKKHNNLQSRYFNLNPALILWGAKILM
jgi:hypothetical protein